MKMNTSNIFSKRLFDIFLFSIFALLGGLLIGISLSKVSLYFTSPRIKPLIFFAGLVFVIWAILSFYQILSLKTSSNFSIQSLLMLFVLCFISFTIFRTIIFHNNKIASSSSSGSASQTFSESLTVPQENDTQNSFYAKEFGKTLHGYFEAEKKIVISDSDLISWITIISKNIDDYVGWTITTSGKIVCDPKIYERGSFSPTRQLMTCCIADLSLVGLTCIYNPESNLSEIIKEGNWVSVTGKLRKGSYLGEAEPQIVCEKIVATTEPEEPYIFP